MKSVKKIREGRERRDSTGSLEEYRKRKREMPREEGKRKEDTFKRSNRTRRSPPGGDDREGDVVGMFKE